MDKKKKIKVGRPAVHESKHKKHMQRTLLLQETKDKLAHYAEKTGLSESDIVRLALNSYFHKMEKKGI